MMASQNSMQQKNYTALFKAEREQFEIINYKHALDGVEEAFILRHKNGGKLT